MMSFKDKKPEFFRMGRGDNLVYSCGAVDEYLAIVEPIAEKYERYVKHLASIKEHGVWGAINRLDAKLEDIKTHLTKWVSGHSDWQMGRMSQWKEELDEIVEGS